jgi:predicted DNA-binding WGR domain protein
MVEARSTHLELVDSDSDKFYRVTEFTSDDGQTVCLTRWGRRGGRGQGQLHSPGDLWSLVDAKLWGGYETIADLTGCVPFRRCEHLRACGPQKGTV